MDVKGVLPALVADAERQLAPLSDDHMQGELTAIVAGLGAGLPQAEKTEWIAAAMITLEKFPAELCREALHDALTACDGLRQVLRHVKDYCEDYPERLRHHLFRLRQLQAIAEGRPVV